jgi:transposase
MRGRWELSDAQWKLIEPVLRPKRRPDGRGRPWRDTRACSMECCGCWAPGPNGATLRLIVLQL